MAGSNPNDKATNHGKTSKNAQRMSKVHKASSSKAPMTPHKAVKGKRDPNSSFWRWFFGDGK